MLLSSASVNTSLNNEQDVLSTGSLERALTSVFRNSVTNGTQFSVLFSVNFGVTDIDVFNGHQHLLGIPFQ